MLTTFHNICMHLKENAGSLAAEIVDSVLDKMKLEIPVWEKEQAVNMYIQLLRSFGKALIAENQKDVPEALIEWSKKNAAMQVSSGGNISEIAVRYPPTREVFSDLLTRIGIEFGLSVEQNAFVIKRINAMLDISLNETIFAFERLSNKYKEETQKELAELSAPIVPVKDNVVILPLIGEIDTYRADYIMQNVVPKISNMEIDYVIADFSGILTINRETAESLHQIGNMFRVMGIHVITTGLRPKVVQTAIQSNINLSAMKAFATVKQALESFE